MEPSGENPFTRQSMVPSGPPLVLKLRHLEITERRKTFQTTRKQRQKMRTDQSRNELGIRPIHHFETSVGNEAPLWDEVRVLRENNQCLCEFFFRVDKEIIGEEVIEVVL